MSKSKPEKNNKNTSALLRPKSAAAASSNWRTFVSVNGGQVGKKKHFARKRKMKSQPKDSDNNVILTTEANSSGNPLRPAPFSSIPKSQLNEFNMFKYDKQGNLVTPLPPNIARHVIEPTTAIALDCEFVDIGLRIGPGNSRDMALARISIVNEYGYVLYHSFVKPKTTVSDYITQFSGVREEDLVDGAELEDVQKIASDLLKGRKLVGHSIDKDLKVLKLHHPKSMIRDTVKYYKKKFGKYLKLQALAKDLFNVDIQTGEHHPTEDAQATMKLYLLNRVEWETMMKEKVRKHR